MNTAVPAEVLRGQYALALAHVEACPFLVTARGYFLLQTPSPELGDLLAVSHAAVVGCLGWAALGWKTTRSPRGQA